MVLLFFLAASGYLATFISSRGSDEDPVKKAWHVIDRQWLDCWHGTGSLEIMPLRSSDVDDLVVHHVNEGHGSGEVADQTQVFSIMGGKLLQTLATQDYLFENGMAIRDALERRSTFLRFPGNALEETRTTTVNDKLKKVERRYWRWSEQERKFAPGPFVLIVAP